MITSLYLKNFRGHKETTLEFAAGVNWLSGPNEAGKTTVGHALAFAFYGADMSGTTRGTDHLITFESERAEVVLKTDKAVFQRTKKRGEGSKVKVGLSGMPLMDADQTSLTQRLGISADVFCSAVFAGYFMDLSNEKRMEVIGQVVKLDRAAMLKELIGDPSIEIPRSVKLVNPRLDATNVANERRRKQNELSADIGALSQVELQIREMLQDAGDQTLDQIQSQIQKLSAQQELFQIYTQELQTYRVQLARSKDAEDQNKRSEAERKKLELALQALGQKPSSEEISFLESEVASLQGKMSGFLAENTKPEPVLNLKQSVDAGSCTRCGQVVTEKLRASIEKERENAISAYNREARAVEDHNQEVLKQWEQMEKSLSQKTELLKSKLTQTEVWNQNHSMIQSRLKDISTIEVRVPEPPMKPEGDEAAIRQSLQELTARRMSIQQMKARYDTAVSRKKLLDVAVQTKTKEIECLKQVEVALLKLPETEVSRTLSQFSMQGVKISLTDNELTVTDPQMIPYESLSTGRRMKIDMEICKTVQGLLGSKAPSFFFIDDYDLLDAEAAKYLPQGKQVFIAKVSDDTADLRVYGVG